MNKCKHRQNPDECLYCRIPGAEELNRRRPKRDWEEEGLTDEEIRAIPLVGRAELDIIEVQYGVKYAKSVLIRDSGYTVVKVLRKHPSFNNLDSRTRVAHIDGYPNLWAIEEIIKRAPHLKAIEVLPVMFEHIKEKALEVAKPRGIVYVTGFAAPELAWADTDDIRPPLWQKHRVFFRTLKGQRKELFDELIEFKIRAGLMTARYFCLDDEPYKAMRALREEFDVGHIHTFSMMVNAVIHYLDQTFPIGSRSFQFVGMMRRKVEKMREEKKEREARLAQLRAAGLQKEAFVKGKQGNRRVNAELLGILFDCKDKGYLAELAQIDKRAHDALVQRQGVTTREDPQPQTLDALGQKWDLTRERIRQLEAKGFKLLGIDPDNPTVPEIGPMKRRQLAGGAPIPKPPVLMVHKHTPTPGLATHSSVRKGAKNPGVPTLEVKSNATSFEIVLTACCRVFCVDEERILSDTRTQPYALVRQVVMYLARHEACMSYPGIAKALDRDHSTVMHGESEIGKRLQNDVELFKQVKLLRAILVPFKTKSDWATASED